MKILILYNKVPYPVKDGGSFALARMAEGFARQNHSVDILALNTKKHRISLKEAQELLPPSIRLFAQNIDTTPRFTKALFNFLFSKEPYNARRFISRNYTRKLIEILTTSNYDLVQIEGLYMLPYLNCVRKHSSASIAFRAHNVENEIWQNTQKGIKNKGKKFYVKILTQRIKRMELSLLNTYDMLVPISSKDAAYFQENGNTKPCFVAPTGIEYSSYNSDNQSFNQKNLFHLGSLDWLPNQEGLLWFLHTVWNKLLPDFPHLQLRIAGRNAPPHFVKKISSFPNVQFLGEINDAREFIEQQTIMIVPLLSGSGMRIKIIEGMAAGKIVIAHPKAAEGIPFVSGKDGFIAESPQDFLDTIRRLQSPSEDLQKISANAQKFIAEHFDNRKIISQLLDFYKKQIPHKI